MKWLVFLFASAFSLICEESCLRSCIEEKEINKCLSDCGCVEKEISLVIESVDIAFVMQKIPLEYNDIVFSLTGCSLYCEEPCWNFENKADILQCLKECNCFELIGIVKASEKKNNQNLDANEDKKNNMEIEEVGIEEIEAIINVVDNTMDINADYNFTENEQQEDEVGKNEIKNDIEKQEEDIEEIEAMDSTEDISRNYNFSEMEQEDEVRKNEIKNDIEKQEADIEEIEAMDSTVDISRNYNFSEIEQQEDKIEENGIEEEQKEAEIENNEQDSGLNIGNENSVVDEEESENQIDQDKSEEEAEEWDINSPNYNITKIFESLIKNLTVEIFDHNQEEQAGDSDNKADLNDSKFNIDKIEPSSNSTEDILSFNNSTDEILPSNNSTEPRENLENSIEEVNEVINNDENIDKNDAYIQPYDDQVDQLTSDNTTTQDLLQMQLNNTTKNEDLKLEPKENYIENSFNDSQEIIYEYSDEKLLIKDSNKTQEIKSENLSEPLIEDINKRQEISSEASAEAASEEYTDKSKEAVFEALIEEVSEGDSNKTQSIEAETSAENMSENNNKTQEINIEASAEELSTEENFQINSPPLQTNFPSENITKNTLDYDSENDIENNKENSENSQFSYQEFANGTVQDYNTIESEDIKIDNNTIEDSSMCGLDECQESSMLNENKTSLSPDDTVVNESHTSNSDDKSTSSRIDDRIPFYYEAEKLSELWGETETYGDKSQEIAENKTSESENSIGNNTEPGLETDNYEYPKDIKEELEEPLENIEENKKINENTAENRAGDNSLDKQKDIPNQEMHENIRNIDTIEAENKQEASEPNLEDVKAIYNNQDASLIENLLKSPDTEAPKIPEINIDASNKQNDSENQKADSKNEEINLTKNQANSPSNEPPKSSDTNLKNNSVNPSSTKVSIGPSNCMVQCSQMCKKQESELKCLEDCLTTFCKTLEESSGWSSFLVIAGNGFSLMFVVYCIWKFIKRKRKYDDDDSMFTPRYYNIS